MINLLGKKALVVLVLISFSLSAAPPDGYELVFRDEFEGHSLDLSKWTFGFGWGLNSGSFSEHNRSQNLTFDGNNAILKAEEVNGQWYSAAINSKNKMTMRYGYWETRVKISGHAPGVLPAFWQKQNHEGWPPELDIFEFFGTDTRLAATIHYQGGSSGQSFDFGDMSGEYHVYGLEYTADFIKWYLNDSVYRTITPTSHSTFFNQWNNDAIYSMFSIHVTDKYGWLGEPDASKMPVYMYVDYFRMYQPVGNSTSTYDILKKENSATNNLAALFPNPANQKITVAFNQYSLGNRSISIHSMDGSRVIKLDYVTEKQLTIDISSLPVGLYFLMAQTGDKAQAMRFIRQK